MTIRAGGQRGRLLAIIVLVAPIPAAGAGPLLGGRGEFG